MNASFRHRSRFGALAVIVLCACSVWAQQREDPRCPLYEDPVEVFSPPDDPEVFDLVTPEQPFEPGLVSPEGSPECPRPDGLSTDNGRPDPKPVPPGEGGPMGQAADDFGETPSRPVGPGADQPDGLVSNLQLMPTYRGNDGGAFYLRKIGQEVFIFGEHPVHQYAMVFSGILSGSQITGEYWDVPKGTRALQGTVSFSVENDGERLVVTEVEGGLGLKSLNSFAIPVLQLPPAIRTPGFYATSAGDLDGAWRSSQSSLYVREVGGNVIGWEEMHFGLGQQPAFARVILANRNGANSMQVMGRYIDLPKGTGLQEFHGTIIVDDAFHIRRLGGQKWYRDVFDVNQLAAEIESRFEGNCVGYGYSIAHEGQIVKGGGGGCRMLGSDGGPLPFTDDTQKDTQSTAKTITAVAALHAMESHGLDVGDLIEPYLPHYWTKGPGVESLTFWHLLSHRSGLSDIGDPDEYDNLKQTIANGAPNQDWDLPAYAYRNANYALFRLIIAYLDSPADMQNFEDNGLRGESINDRCSKRYLDYVQTHVLQPAGLGTRHAYYTSDNYAYSYNFEDQGVAGYPQQAGQMYEMGAGGWVLSAKDYAKFLAALENGEILGDEMLGKMKLGLLGLVWIDSPLGATYGHGGSIGGGSDGSYGSGRGARAQSLILPNNVQIFITINSANNDPSIDGSEARMEALRDSFVESLHPTP